MKLLMTIVAMACAWPAAAAVRFGTATIDITPEGPIRLNGYAARQTESEGAGTKLYAKALAIETAAGRPALVLTVDTCAVSREFYLGVAAALEAKHGLPADRLAILSSHTHYAPFLNGAIPNMFAAPLPEEQQAKVDRYTRELSEMLVRAGSEALSRLAPGRIYFGRGEVDFAKNRRTPGGPVDHDVPVLVFKDAGGSVKAVFANYACHCTTIESKLNRTHPDWAGLARGAVEERHPGATALIGIGCGADSNPSPRGSVELAAAHGGKLAAELERVIASPLEEITGELGSASQELELPFEPLPTREEWLKRSETPGIVGYHAKKNLARLDRGETLPTSLPYRVQVWHFGTKLAMAFLPGEVVVDYALRLKKDFEPGRLWLNAYANWVPCYIPSARVLREGGYEAETSLWYYDRPARLSAQIEDTIVAAVEKLIPAAFRRH